MEWRSQWLEKANYNEILEKSKILFVEDDNMKYFLDIQNSNDETIYVIFSLQNEFQDISQAKLEAVYYTKSKALEDLEYLNYMARKRNIIKIQKKS